MAALAVTTGGRPVAVRAAGPGVIEFATAPGARYDVTAVQ